MDGKVMQTFVYRGNVYPEYLKHGNACRFVAAIARELCTGRGIDVGCGKWPLDGAVAFDIANGDDAMNLPDERYDFVFSSHCLEHLANPIAAIEHWRTRIIEGGRLFLYLPHPDMEYWLPQNCRKHLHSWRPAEMARIIKDLGFCSVMHSERDLAWGFVVTGQKSDC